MIPESIKIDDDGSFYITIYDFTERITFECIEEAYLLAKSKKYPQKVKYGCHVDEHEEVYDY
jgi:hypothetical protein